MTNSDDERRFEEMSQYDPANEAVRSYEMSKQSALEMLGVGEPVVLYGPPGTGKSHMAAEMVDQMNKSDQQVKKEEIQFHQKFSYEDFMQGYRPTKDGGFELKHGVFRDLCREARDNPEIEHILIIDEFNRAELSSTLGELLYLIENRDERSARLPDDPSFSVPENINIIGTMNTADRNIAVMDFALRRRFTFIPVYPDYEVMEEWLREIGFSVDKFSVEEYCQAAEALNLRIMRHSQMNKHMQLGHALFVPDRRDGQPVTLGAITNVFDFTIIPQLERYLGFGREDELDEFVGSDIAWKLRRGKSVLNEDIVNMIQDLTNDMENQ